MWNCRFLCCEIFFCKLRVLYVLVSFNDSYFFYLFLLIAPSSHILDLQNSTVCYLFAWVHLKACVIYIFTSDGIIDKGIVLISLPAHPFPGVYCFHYGGGQHQLYRPVSPPTSAPSLTTSPAPPPPYATGRSQEGSATFGGSDTFQSTSIYTTSVSQQNTGMPEMTRR